MGNQHPQLSTSPALHATSRKNRDIETHIDYVSPNTIGSIVAIVAAWVGSWGFVAVWRVVGCWAGECSHGGQSGDAEHHDAEVSFDGQAVFFLGRATVCAEHV